SGTEKTRKPFPDIYKLTLNRFNIDAESSIFIDDNLRNIKAAERMGISGIHFKNPEQLLLDLKEYGIKI
ncbi:MAG: HAD-IA family hydrolase, partial [Flavobacteriaceae bacterium]|nr:HAD-IA family hydrolase [Flavobacteriaceae bacterium]